MRFVRGLGGVLLWLLASIVGLLGAVLCVTIILLPLGIPLLLVARRMFATSMKLLLPREMTHPVDEASKSLRKTGKKARKKLKGGHGTGDVASAGKKAGKKARKKLEGGHGTGDVAGAGKKAGKQARKRMRKGGRRARKRLAG